MKYQNTHINPACGVGVPIQLALQDCYNYIHRKAEEAIHSITLQEVLERCERKAK